MDKVQKKTLYTDLIYCYYTSILVWFSKRAENINFNKLSDKERTSLNSMVETGHHRIKCNGIIKKHNWKWIIISFILDRSLDIVNKYYFESFNYVLIVVLQIATQSKWRQEINNETIILSSLHDDTIIFSSTGHTCRI